MPYRMEYRLQAGFTSLMVNTRINAVLRTLLPAVLLLSLQATGASAQKPLSGYDLVTVDKVTVEKTAEKLPSGYDTLIQERIVDALRKKKVFPEVINALLEANDPPAPAIPARPVKRLVLKTSIIEYRPGNRALRYTIGWGTGATRIKARFTFTDPGTGQEIFSTTQQGKFLGFINIIGPGRNHSAGESSGDLIDALVREINKQR